MKEKIIYHIIKALPHRQRFAFALLRAVFRPLLQTRYSRQCAFRQF